MTTHHTHPDDLALPSAQPIHAALDHYLAVESTCRQMLAGAQCADWESVRAGEVACAELIAVLRSKACAEPLPDALRSHKHQIMRRILALDARVRDLAEPGQARYHSRYQPARVGAVAPAL